MTSDLLLRCFMGITHEQEKKLRELFVKLESKTNLFCVIMVEEAGKYKFTYVSESVETVTGHSLSNFSYHGGSSFFYSITPPNYRLLVLEQESRSWNKARQSGFDFSKPFIVEINAGIEHKSKKIIALSMISLIFELTKHCTPKSALCTWQSTERLTEEQLLSAKMDTKNILTEIHQHYKTSSLVTSSNPEADSPLRLTYQVYDIDEITKQEYRVLKLLADGCSTKEIAEQLCVSINTVETHRRHLLQKFNAKNMAELIKKATKVFWLE